MADGLGWIEDDPAVSEFGYGLVFVRGLDPRELVGRLGGELISREPMSAVDADAVEVREQGIRVIRVGADGEWAFAVALYGPLGDCRGDTDVTCVVSAGSEAVSYGRTVNFDTWFSFSRDGLLVCGLEPGCESPTGAALAELEEGFGRADLLGDGISGDAWQRALVLGETQFGLSLPKQSLTEGALLAARVPRTF